MKKTSRSNKEKKGYALIATVSILSLIAMIALAMVSLASSVTKTESHAVHLERAKANARMGLTMALGQLQRYAGPDQRVTAGAEVYSSTPVHPHWTGVWSSKNEGSLPVWLVSGNEALGPSIDEFSGDWEYAKEYRTPDRELDDAYKIFQGRTVHDKVSVPLVKVEQEGNLLGKYGWWVADEGCKARVDLGAAPVVDPGARAYAARVPREMNMQSASMELQQLPSNNNQTEQLKKRLISLSTLDLAVAGTGLSDAYFHDFTSGGYGLPVDVKNSSFKTDLSVVFDSSQRTNRDLLLRVMGAWPTKTSNSHGQMEYRFDHSSLKDMDTFYFLPEYAKNQMGPNWGNLYCYAHLYESVKNGEMSYISARPSLQSDVRSNSWAPYTRSAIGNWRSENWRSDYQHRNAVISPIFGMMQLGMRLSSRKTKEAEGGNPAEYGVSVEVKPVIALWNPYNVRLSTALYTIELGLYPYLRLGFEDANGEVQIKQVWMRDHWLRRDILDGEDNAWFKMRTDPVDFAPGEVRLFSVDRQAGLTVTNKLVPTWNEGGAYVFNIRSNEVSIPEGNSVWYEAAYLEDTQHPETYERFDRVNKDARSASYASLKTYYNAGSDGPAVQRVADVWVNPKKEDQMKVAYKMPSQLDISDVNKQPVESLASSGAGPMHIATWRWMARTTSQAAESQRTRGMADFNARFMAGSARWDGSQVNGDGEYEGWHFISPYIGGSVDGESDGLGKVAEGSNEVPAYPEAIMQNGRYQGFQGYSNFSQGQTHVPLFDVPRYPLVSIGQFQHAQLGRYNYEPSYVLGNSYASSRIPLYQTKVENFSGIDGFTMIDSSYYLNQELWDSYFFSTLGKDYFTREETGELDDYLSLADVLGGRKSLPNSRYVLSEGLGRSESFAEIFAEAPESLERVTSSRIQIPGAFNVNSISVTAWKAFLGSMQHSDVAQLSEDGSNFSWKAQSNPFISKFGMNLRAEGWNLGDSPLGERFWQGFRSWNDEEMEALAVEIVKEVKARGPFRSMAQFVNRDPNSERKLSQRKGALQAALDRTLNSQGAIGQIGNEAKKPEGVAFSDAVDQEIEAAGFAGFVNQSDILQTVAPVIQVRSDSFKIRAVGQSHDGEGNLKATVVCEARVQRCAEYFDQADLPYIRLQDLSSEINKEYGRRFQLVDFRYLSPGELE